MWEWNMKITVVIRPSVSTRLINSNFLARYCLRSKLWKRKWNCRVSNVWFTRYLASKQSSKPASPNGLIFNSFRSFCHLSTFFNHFQGQSLNMLCKPNLEMLTEAQIDNGCFCGFRLWSLFGKTGTVDHRNTEHSSWLLFYDDSWSLRRARILVNWFEWKIQREIQTKLRIIFFSGGGRGWEGA